jgi:hypothetical protein
MRQLRIRLNILWALLSNQYTWSFRHNCMWTWTKPAYTIILSPVHDSQLERYKQALEEIKEIAELPPVDGAILRIATKTLEDS